MQSAGPKFIITSDVDMSAVKREARSILRGHGDGLGSSAPDVYSVVFHSADAHVITAGHDRTVRLYDVETSHVRPRKVFRYFVRVFSRVCSGISVV